MTSEAIKKMAVDYFNSQYPTYEPVEWDKCKNAPMVKAFIAGTKVKEFSSNLYVLFSNFFCRHRKTKQITIVGIMRGGEVLSTSTAEVCERCKKIIE